MIFNIHALLRRFYRPCACLMVGCLVLTSLAGCNIYRNLGSGTHLDKARDRPVPSGSTKVRDMVVEVTTNASGEVINVEFKRSSGSEPVDTHVADSIHNNWPRQASTITDAELTYSMANGFSEPKILSTRPAL